MDEGTGVVKTIPLRRHTRIMNGGTPTADPLNWGGEVAWATPVDLARVDGGVVDKTDRTLTLRGASSGSRIAPPGAVLLSTRAPIGYTALTWSPMAFNQGCKAVVPDANLDPRFLQYSLCALSPVLKASGSGSTFLELSAESLAEQPLASVELDEQRRIADFLDDRVSKIDRIIAARREQTRLVAELHAERLKLCVAGVFDASVPTKPTTVGWLTQMHQEAEAVRLSQVVTLQRGVDLTEDQRRPGTVQVVTTAGVVGTHDEFVSTGPGVVIGRYGSVGNVHWIEGPHWPHNTTLYVRSTYGNDLRWIYYLLLTFPYEALQARAAVPGVNRNDMASEIVPWIPRHLQAVAIRHLDSTADDLDNRTSSLNRGVDLLTEYKTSLITAAVTGGLDVTTAGSNIPG